MTANLSADELDYVQIDRKLIERAVVALDRAKSADLKVVTAESCTGGLIARAKRQVLPTIFMVDSSRIRPSKNVRLSSSMQN